MCSQPPFLTQPAQLPRDQHPRTAAEVPRPAGPSKAIWEAAPLAPPAVPWSPPTLSSPTVPPPALPSALCQARVTQLLTYFCLVFLPLLAPALSPQLNLCEISSIIPFLLIDVERGCHNNVFPWQWFKIHLRVNVEECRM